MEKPSKSMAIIGIVDEGAGGWKMKPFKDCV